VCGCACLHHVWRSVAACAQCATTRLLCGYPPGTAVVPSGRRPRPAHVVAPPPHLRRTLCCVALLSRAYIRMPWPRQRAAAACTHQCMHADWGALQVGLQQFLERCQTRSDGAALDMVADWSTQMSLGEQQRLAFGRVLLANPALVLLDESRRASTRSCATAAWHSSASATARACGSSTTASLTCQPLRSWRRSLTG
jgi:hypothetical protein